MPSYKELIDQKKSYKIYFSKFYGMVIFYTEKSQEKLPCGLFLSSETSEKIHNSNLLVKIWVWNVISSNEMEK